MSRIFFFFLLLLGMSANSWSADAAAGAQAAAVVPTGTSVVDPSAVDVSVTDKCTKYHTKDCRFAKQGKSESLAAALTDGLEPCSVCHPPIYDPALITVYTGGDKSAKYHTKDCRFAKSPETLAQAAAASQEPCKICHAPPLPPAKAAAAAAGSPVKAK